MLIRPTPPRAQVSPTAHGVLASTASLILGVGAHALGGQHVATASQFVVLIGLALVVGVLRAGQVRTVEKDRLRGRVRIGRLGAIATLAGGQAGAHIALSLIDGHSGHDGGSMVPGPAMVFWHAVAVPAAGGLLVLAERLSRLCGGRLDRTLRLVSASLTSLAAPAVRVVDLGSDRLRPAPMSTAAGVRGPPVLV